jgi:NAD+ synthase
VSGAKGARASGAGDAASEAAGDPGSGTADGAREAAGPGTSDTGGGAREPTAGAGTGALFELPPELAIDTGVARRVIVGFIRGQLRQAGFDRIVIGLSGGIDSALVAYLSAEAVGPERLLSVLMPYRSSSPSSAADARAVVERLGCPSRLVEITPMVDGYFGDDRGPGALHAGRDRGDGEVSPLRRGNLMARMRMAVLYDLSADWRGLVAGTGNKTETLIGYTTLFGDSACAFAPIGDLYKSQVRQLAAAVGVPEGIIRKAPSADLWPGQTDESEGEFSYPVIDRLLYWMVDRRRGTDELVTMGFDRGMVERVERMVAASEFKRQVPPVAKLGPRTAGVDYLYPRRRPGSSANP